MGQYPKITTPENYGENVKHIPHLYTRGQCLKISKLKIKNSHLSIYTRDNVKNVYSLGVQVTNNQNIKNMKKKTRGMSQRIAHLRERLKLVEVFDRAEELETDAGRDDEEAHREEDETAKLLARTKDLRHSDTDVSDMDLTQLHGS